MQKVGEYFGFQKASVVELTDKTIKLEINEDLSDTIKKGFSLEASYDFELGFVRTLIYS